MTKDQKAVECDLRKYFDEVRVISLKHTPDRLDEFRERFQKEAVSGVREFVALDGLKLLPPWWWMKRGTAGQWGRYQSHLRVVEEAVISGAKSLLIFEDDALPIDGIAGKMSQAMDQVPDDWNLLYFGGRHGLSPWAPVKIKKDLPWLKVASVYRHHAYAIKGADLLLRLYQHLQHIIEMIDQGRRYSLDERMAVFHRNQKCVIYTPENWFFGQAAGDSLTEGRFLKARWWELAERYRP